METLAVDLPSFGVDVHIEEADGWIPNETGKKVDRQVSERLRAVASDFDWVHAFGYRAAWACAEAFGKKECWFYSAYDMPKTTHPELAERLDQAQCGFASSEAVRRILRDALVDEVRVVTPGVAAAASAESRDAARERLELPPESPVLGALGRWVPERGFSALIESMERVWGRLPDAHLVLAGEGPLAEELQELASKQPRASQISILPWRADASNLLDAFDLIVVPSTRQGFSMVAAEAMLLGQTVLLRRTGGLPEMIDERVSGFLFDSDADLGDTAAGLLQSPMTLGVVGNAARVRAEDRFDRRVCAEAVARACKEFAVG